MVAREWTRIGVTGFGGPPAHIALLRKLMVERRGWMDAHEFEDANAACALLPGPASTQLAIFCAYRVRGRFGAIIGGLGFIVPAVVAMLALSVVFLASSPPTWVRGAGAGAASAVAAVAVHAGMGLVGPSRARARDQFRWFAYLLAGGTVAALGGPFVVLVLLLAGATELLVRRRVVATFHPGLIWVAFKVGALSYGGGFVIIPLMQGDAVHVYHWMTDAQFLNTVALGQVTPGPVVATVAGVGYGASGLAGGIVAAIVAFMPSFAFVLLGGRHFEQLRNNDNARAFLDGAGPAAIGAIFGAAITLALALSEPWQFVLLAVAAVALLLLRRGVVPTLLGAAAVGVVLALAGASLPG
jgi:chromate transporter